MSREVLPNRRRSETFQFEAGVPGQPQHEYVATLGFYPDGRLGEIFLHPIRTGSDRDLAVQEAAIAISFALQHGCTVEMIRSAMPRTVSDEPEGPMGTLLDKISAILGDQKIAMWPRIAETDRVHDL